MFSEQACINIDIYPFKSLFWQEGDYLAFCRNLCGLKPQLRGEGWRKGGLGSREKSSDDRSYNRKPDNGPQEKSF